MDMEKKNTIRNQARSLLAKLLILCLVMNSGFAAYGATEEAQAASVKVLKSDGTVQVRNSSGRVLSLVEGMKLYNGYQVVTEEKSYAYMSLDDSKLATLDAVSDMHLERKGGDLALMLNSGKLFFDVSAKLGDEETMNIHTANVSLGVRGTSGLVWVIDSKHTRVYLFDGQIDASVTNQINEQKKEIRMTPGMTADFYIYDMDRAGDKCEIVVRGYEEGEIPGFVLREMKKNPALVERILNSGGGDFRPYLEQAEEKLDEDEAQMHEILEEIRRKYGEQSHSDRVIPVFGGEDSSEDSSGSAAETAGSTVVEETTEDTVYEAATLLSGSQINAKFQELLNYADSQALRPNPFRMEAYAGVADLTAIQYAPAAPSEDAYTVELQSAGSPVYAWYQSGTIYLYSDAPQMAFPADCSGLLSGFYNLTDISGLAKFDTSNVTNLASAFSTLRSLADFSPISGWDVSNVTDLSYAFEGCLAMTNLSALSGWDTGNVTDISYAFAYNTGLTSVDGIADWNTSSVTAFDNLFSGCSSLADASSLSTHTTDGYTAWDLKESFKNASKAEQFSGTGVAADTSYAGYPSWFMKNYRFIGEDGTTAVFTASIPMDATDLNATLQEQLAANAPEFLKSWNTSADGSGSSLDAMSAELVMEDVDFHYMPMEATLVTGSELRAVLLAFASSPTSIQWSDSAPGAGITTTTISTADSDAEVVCWMETIGTEDVVKLYGEVRNVYLNPDSSKAFQSMYRLSDITGLAHLDCSKVTNMSEMFSSCSALSDLSPIAGWDTSNVTKMDSMFEYHHLTDLSPLSGWDTSSVVSMQGMFGSAPANNSVTDLDALSHWDTSSLTNMSLMFAGCSLKNASGLSAWDVSKVTDMSRVFNGCSQLEDISGLSSWDTSGVTDMTRIFGSNTMLSDISSLAQWDVSNVTNLDYAFTGTAIETLTALQDWDVSNMISMEHLFDGCSSLQDISGLSSWETSNVTSMASIFNNTMISDISSLAKWKVDKVTNLNYAFKATEIDDLSALQGWDVSSVTDMGGMFQGCNQLTDESLQELKAWNVKNVENMSFMFFSCSNLTDATALNEWAVNSATNVLAMFNYSGVNPPQWYSNDTVITPTAAALTLDAGTGSIELYNIAAASQITFYAEPQSISAANPDPLIVEEEYITEALELPQPEHDTKIFAEWNTDQNGTGDSYQAGETFTIEGETVLYAMWTDATPSNATPSNATPSDAAPADATASDDTFTGATPSNAGALLSEEESPDTTAPDSTLPAEELPLEEERKTSLAALYVESQAQKNDENEDEAD